MRITFNIIRDGLDALDTAANQMATAQAQVASGKRVNVPSDDPSAAQRAVGDHAELAAIDSYTSATDAASSRLAAMDSVLGDLVDKITQAKTAVASAMGSTASNETRTATASTLTAIRDAVASDINTKFGGMALFSGAVGTAAAYTSNGDGTWTYNGDATAVTASVNRGQSVIMTMDGSKILQGSDASDLLTMLDKLITSASSTTDFSAAAAGMAALNQAFDRATLAQSTVGAGEATTDDVRQRLTTLRTAADAQRSADEDANIAEAISTLNRAQTAYKAALGAVGSASNLSLMDYIK